MARAPRVNVNCLQITKNCNPIVRLSAVSLFTRCFINAATRALKSECSPEKGDQCRVSLAQQWGSGQVASNCCFLFMCSMLTSLNPLILSQ